MADEPPPSSSWEPGGWLRKLVGWLRWPPFTLICAVLTVWFALFGPPDTAWLAAIFGLMTMANQVGAAVGELPRWLRCAIAYYDRVVAMLEGARRWLNGLLGQIDRVVRDQWDGKDQT